MKDLFIALAAAAADRHGVFTTAMAQRVGVSDRLRNEWLATWLDHPSRHAHIPIRRKSWHMVGDCRIGDRRRRRHRRSVRTTAGALMHLDGFVRGRSRSEVPRSSRNRGHGSVTRSSPRGHCFSVMVVTIDGIRCVSAERLIQS